MMQPPESPQPVYGQYAAPGERNSLASVSLDCAILWPLATWAMFLVNSVADVAGPGGTATPPPEPLHALLNCGFLALPVAGIAAGGISLYRAMRHPRLRRTLWWAIPGLLLGCLWFVTAYVVIG